MNLPPNPNDPNQEKPFAYQAASLCLLAPLLIFIAGAAVRGLPQIGQMSRMAQLLIGVTFLGVIAGGIFMGIVALCGIRKNGPERILIRSIIGLVLNSLFLILFVSGFVSGFKNAVHSNRVMSDMQDTVEQMKKNNREAFNSETGITNVNLEAVDRIRAQLDDASKNLTGTDALITKGMAGYVGEIQGTMKNFQAAMESLRAAQVLRLSNLETVDQLAERRKVIKNFLSANSAVAGVISNSEQIIQTRLEALKVPPAAIKQTLAGFRSRAADRNVLVLQIRECDARSGKSMLGILDLLEANWGKWKFDPAAQVVNFDEPEARQSYTKLATEIEEAGQEEISLQGRLVNLQ